MAGFSRQLSLPLSATAAYALLWLVLFADWFWVHRLPAAAAWSGFALGLAVAVAWSLWATWPVRRRPLVVSAVLSGAFVVAWHFSVFACHELGLDGLRALLARVGLGAFFLVGLCWVVWLVERASQFYEAQRAQRRRQRAQTAPATLMPSVPVAEDEPDQKRNWNLLDPQCWLYGRKGRKLNQSLTALLSYSLLFIAGFFLITQLGGCHEVYEMPAGGGEQKAIAQQVQVQKIKRIKYVVNPFSSILFEVPPIEQIVIPIQEMTAHTYTVGYGQGEGAGFAGGTKTGKVRFIRLEYPGGDWNAGAGIGADLNMLIEYGIRTRQPVADRTESRTVAQLRNFPAGKAPPFVYMTGQKNVSLSASEIKILREYLLEKHGMIFCDNSGSMHFHNQFIAMMRQVLPNVRYVKVPLDDVIHRVPYPLPFLPYVAPHGGRDALGWKVDGRWVAYYHPGDIGDAWMDDHSGVPRHIWEACYQLGVNVIFYAHVEHSKWLAARGKDE